MRKHRVITAILCAVAVLGRAAEAPNISLPVPRPFATEVTVKRYRKGQDLLYDPTFHLITVAPLTEYHGWYGSRVASQAAIHAWTVYVFARYSQKAAAAIAEAQDGYEADLSIEPEFFGLDERAYMFACFECKRFRWGSAVSFLSQTVQDVEPYVPTTATWNTRPGALHRTRDILSSQKSRSATLSLWLGVNTCESRLLWRL
jgi:hypothetical protein